MLMQPALRRTQPTRACHSGVTTNQNKSFIIIITIIIIVITVIIIVIIIIVIIIIVVLVVFVVLVLAPLFPTFPVPVAFQVPLHRSSHFLGLSVGSGAPFPTPPARLSPPPPPWPLFPWATLLLP